MRVDANVSVHKPGTPSRHPLRDQERQQCAFDRPGHRVRGSSADRSAGGGDTVRQETRHWDEGDGRTHTLRSKEDADDYRYFLEPDLVPLVPSQEWIASVRAALPMLPAARRARLAEATGVAADSEAAMVVVDRGQDDYVLAVGEAGGDVARALVHVKEAWADVAVGAGRGPRQADH